MELSHAAVLVLVTSAAYFDLATKKIPNALNYTACALGFLLGGIAAGWEGLLNSGLGFLAGFVPLFLLYIGGSMGGGDVKLMGGVGALLGFPAGLNALLSAILVGGFFAAVILLWQGRLWGILRYGFSKLWSYADPRHTPLEPPEHKDAFPFGVAIALGTYLTLISIELGRNTPANLFV